MKKEEDTVGGKSKSTCSVKSDQVTPASANKASVSTGNSPICPNFPVILPDGYEYKGVHFRMTAV